MNVHGSRKYSVTCVGWVTVYAAPKVGNLMNGTTEELHREDKSHHQKVPLRTITRRGRARRPQQATVWWSIMQHRRRELQLRGELRSVAVECCKQPVRGDASIPVMAFVTGVLYARPYVQAKRGKNQWCAQPHRSQQNRTSRRVKRPARATQCVRVWCSVCGSVCTNDRR